MNFDSLPDTAKLSVCFVAVSLLALAYALYRVLFGSNTPKIQNVPEIPGAFPILGHLPLLGGTTGEHDATVWSQWSEKWSWDVFQMKFGVERVVVANTYDSIKELWVGNSASLISRPIPYIIENFVGREMGAAPWDEPTKRQRGAAVKSVAPGTWNSYYPMLDKDSRAAIEAIRDESAKGATSVSLREHLVRVSMNLGFQLSYGKTLEDLGGLEFLKGFTEAAGEITDVRAGSSNWIDYLPFLRIFPSKRARIAYNGAQKREPYLKKMYESMKDDWEAGGNISCIGANLLADRASKGSKLTDDDVKATCIAMLQGSSETISSTLACGFGFLSATETGLNLQDESYAAIIERWSTPQSAFDNAFEAEDIPIVVGLYKEMLRYYCVAPYSLPRLTSRNITMKDGKVIPKGVTMLMNAQAGNHDPAYYGPDAMEFNPHRFTDHDSPISSTSLPHFSYGAGARICPAMQISNRIMYALILRLIVSFRFVASKEMPPEIHPYKFNLNIDGPIAKGKDFKVYCMPRDLNDGSELENVKQMGDKEADVHVHVVDLGVTS